jgi:hypothetical protein
MIVAASSSRFLPLAAVLALVLAAPASADTKLNVRLDPDAAHDSILVIRLKSKDSHGPETARSNAGAREWTCVEQQDETSNAPINSAPREYYLEVLKAEQVVLRFKLTLDAQQAARYLDREPGTLRELSAAEKGALYVTVHYPPGTDLAKQPRERFEAATGKRCPPLIASVEYSGALPERQPVLHSELRPAPAAVDKKYDVYYSSLEVARCVQIFSDNGTGPIADYHPAVVRSYADWMTRNFAILRGKTLAEIALPGTHDSGAYVLGDRKSPDRSTAEWLAGLSMNITKPWAITQRLDIRDQLEGGIRWLDMRTAFDGNDFYFYHALLGPKTRDMLRQIRAFLDEPGHEHELIVLEFCNWQGFTGESRDQPWERLGKMILTELGEDNVYRKDVRDTAKTESGLMSTRLGDILTGSQSRVIVFFQGHTEQAPFAYDALVAYGGSYANRHLWSSVEADQRAKLAAHRPGPMFILSWTVTADQEVIAEDLANRAHADRPPFNLEYLTRGGQGDSMWRIALCPGHEKINVVICDFFDSSLLLPLCLKLNGIQAKNHE